MPRFIIWIFAFCLPYLAQAHVTVVSLGSDCQVAAMLRDFNLRSDAYPFDWVVTEDFESVIDGIEDDFVHWVDAAHLEYRGNNIYNKYYNFSFVHDFPILGCPGMSDEDFTGFGAIDPNYLHYLPHTIDKYNRRVTRLQNLFYANNPVVFVRAHANRKSAQRFVSVMKAKYPNLPFVLIVVTRAGLLNPPWNLPQVLNFYVPDEQGHMFAWWWGWHTWQTIFKQSTLLP